MASESKLENVMLTGQNAYFKKNGSMTNHGTIELENALSSHSYDEGYIGPNSILHGTDLATTEEYTQCEIVMKNYLGDNWEETENERSIITNSNKIKSMLLPEENNMQKLYNDIAFDGTELQYIRSSGTQYINLGIPANTVYGVEFKFVPYGNSDVAYESYLSGRLDNFTIAEQNTTYSQAYLKIRGTEIFSSVSVNTSFSNPNILRIMNGTVTLNSNTYSATTSAISTYSDNLYLFNNPALSRYATMYFMELKLYASDYTTLLADLIPCKDPNGTVCVYDKVKKKYLYNNGTGTFTAGPSLDTTHTELEYIETDGTQRIDLNLTAKSNSGFYIDFMPLEDFTSSTSTGSKCIIAAGGNDTKYFLNFVRYEYINICSRPNYPKGSIQIGRGTTPLDAKLVQYQRTQIELKNNVLTLGDGTTITTSQGRPYNNTVKWRLFNFYSSRGSIDAKSKVRFYGCKIYEGDEIVADIIPVKDKFNIGCVYDKITDTLLYADINSDTIKLGPVKNN